jgi:hypothetical protein
MIPMLLCYRCGDNNPDALGLDVETGLSPTMDRWTLSVSYLRTRSPETRPY